MRSSFDFMFSSIMIMSTVTKPVVLAALVAGSVFAGEKNPTKQELEAMLGKKESYEYNLVGKRLLRPVDETLLKHLVEKPEEAGKHDYVLSSWLLRIAAEGDRNHLWLLDSKELQKDGETADLLLAYDYNVNGNPKALATLLERLRKAMKERRTWGVPHLHALAAVNEWDRCRQALGSHGLSADGAGGDERYGFWLKRRYLFPDNKKFPDNYETFCRDLEQLQAAADQAATRTGSKPEDNPEPQPESEGRSR
jgi:hypothetical protein